jgi:Domain of unknown function (DUF4112)
MPKLIATRRARTDAYTRSRHGLASDATPPVSRPVAGEVIGRSRAERFAAVEARIRRVTNILDELLPIPGTRHRFGVDPIIGLIPVVGDVIGALVGLWVIGEATRFGVPRIVVARMTVNLLVDLAVGIIPFVGDIFDFVSRSNTRNIELFKTHALDPDASTAGHQAFFAGVVLVVLGAIWLVTVLVVRFFEALGNVLFG